VRWLVPVLAVFAGSPVIAQSRDVKPQFEVASIKRCVGPQPPARLSFSSGRLHLPCWGLLSVIQDAYQIYADGKSDFMIQPPSVTRLEGFPEQLSSDRYTIDAKAESPQGMGMMRGPMMQELLEERFHLKVHREIREVPVYIMTVAKDGPKMPATKEDSCSHAEPADLLQVYPALALPETDPGLLSKIDPGRVARVDSGPKRISG
jgi:uncharacterized protein (TIGR03435 family)